MRPIRCTAMLALGLALGLPALDAAAQAPLTYGPVLTRRPAGMEAPPTVPATPAAAPEAEAAAAPPASPARTRTVPRRHPALQGTGPMAPRPLHPSEAAAITGTVPVPAPAAAPQPVVPGSTIAGSCQGGLCTDAAGNTMNRGAGTAGMGSDGRLCVRGAATVQCF